LKAAERTHDITTSLAQSDARSARSQSFHTPISEPGERLKSSFAFAHYSNSTCV